MNIAELFARIGIKTDEEKVKSFSRSMTAAKITLFAVTTAATTASIAIQKITSDAMKGAVAFKQFETETGASAQELQKWQAVAEQTNQSAESVSSAIKAIASNQEKIRLGQGDISGFQLLGIDPHTDPFKILEKLRDETTGLSNAMKKNILASMGVGAGMLQTLSLTEKEFDRMASRAFIISPKAIETLNKTKASIDHASRAIKYIKAQIAVGLSPQIEKLTERTIEFIKANEKGFVKGFKKAFTFVEKFTGAIINAANSIDRIIRSTIGWKTALWSIAAVMTAIFIASPIGLIIAGVILLVALLDDLYVYSKGGKSLFGEFMKGLSDIDGILDKWGVFGDLIQGIIEGIKTVTRGSEKVFDFFKKGEEGLVKEYAPMTGNDKLMQMMGREPSMNFNIKVDVFGSGDPEATGNAAATAIQRQINGASSQRSRNE